MFIELWNFGYSSINIRIANISDQLFVLTTKDQGKSFAIG